MSEEVKEAHALLQDAQRIGAQLTLLERFIDTASDATVIVDPQGRIVLFNRKATFLFGWQASEIIGKPVEILLPDALRARHAEVHRPSYGKDPYPRAMAANLDLKAQHKDGSTFLALIDLQPEMGLEGMFVRAAIRRREAEPDNSRPSEQGQQEQGPNKDHPPDPPLPPYSRH
jgi:PAS domain S-box-containing protein